jgi:hypothetical protein
MTKTRNSAVLESFVAYCRANPDHRFWQALRNWSGRGFVYLSDKPPMAFTDDVAMRLPSELNDTFYWETKDGK